MFCLCLTLPPTRRSVRPNVFLALGEGSAQHRRWYYELAVDHVEPFLTAEPTHLRVGWANAEGYGPWPTAGEGCGGNGVGDDLYSYGFDGLHLWSGEVGGRKQSFMMMDPISNKEFTYFWVVPSQTNGNS